MTPCKPGRGFGCRSAGRRRGVLVFELKTKRTGGSRRRGLQGVAFQRAAAWLIAAGHGRRTIATPPPIPRRRLGQRSVPADSARTQAGVRPGPPNASQQHPSSNPPVMKSPTRPGVDPQLEILRNNDVTRSPRRSRKVVETNSDRGPGHSTATSRRPPSRR